MSNSSGTVYWFTGLAGSGKTTLASLFYQKLKANLPQTILLDGDELREIFGNDLTYSIEDRKKSAYRNARLCAHLAKQGINVVCATISLFHEIHEWNRENMENYTEIFIDTPLEVLHKRNQKKLYSGQQNVVGVTIAPEFPLNPDFKFDNSYEVQIEDNVNYLYQKLVA